MEEAPREISRYSIAFAKANHKCGTVVQFYDNDILYPVGNVSANRFLAGVEIVNSGSGYTTPPTITFSGGVSCASAIVKVNGGSISEVLVINQGIGTNNDPIILTIGGTNQTAILRPIEGGCVIKQKDTIKLDYTNENYLSPTEFPKVPPYPNIGGSVPNSDEYITGSEYITMVGDGSGSPGQLGTGKRLTDLPSCIATPLRVDIIPSIEKMSYYKPGGRCIKNIIVEEGGSGYVVGNINITIEDPPDSDNKPVIGNIIIDGDGAILSVDVISGGMGYITPPIITVNIGVTQAKLIANLCAGEEDSRIFNAYVFGGNNPSQLITWESQHGSFTTTHRTSGGVVLSDTGIFKPYKTVELARIPIIAKMYSTPTIFGEATLYLEPQIMSDWPTPEKGYTSGKNMVIKFWVFGGGTNQNLNIVVKNSSTTPSSSTFNTSTNTLTVGNNEMSKYLILEVTSNSSPQLDPLILNVYKKYIQLTSDEDGNNIVEYHIISAGYNCGDEIQLYSWLRIDDRTEYESFNYTRQEVTTLSNWSISGNTLPETKIEDGLLTLGIRDTVYQSGFVIPSGQFIYIPGDGEITSIKIINGGENYDSDFQATITASNGNVIELELEVDDGKIIGVTISDGDNSGFTPLDEIEIILPDPIPDPLPTGFKYELVIDEHLEVDGIPTVFIRECEKGNIRINVNYDGVIGSTRTP